MNLKRKKVDHPLWCYQNFDIFRSCSNTIELFLQQSKYALKASLPTISECLPQHLSRLRFDRVVQETNDNDIICSSVITGQQLVFSVEVLYTCGQ